MEFVKMKVEEIVKRFHNCRMVLEGAERVIDFYVRRLFQL